jgi:hypothetical protein
MTFQEYIYYNNLYQKNNKIEYLHKYKKDNG